MIAGALTGLLILLFLGSWRSTLIITISIPLSILASIFCLSALGETINIMTLGGLALAVGILVDDATVTIENINYHLEHGKEVETAILDGAHQIALPALVSTLSICIVFVPMFLLAGIAKYLFIPLAEAVVFAMLASYMLSRTLVPTLAKFWLKKHDRRRKVEEAAILWRVSSSGSNAASRLCASGYRSLAGRRGRTAARALQRYFSARWRPQPCWPFRWGRCPAWARISFPAVDGGQIKLHVRARTGTRIEETAALCDAIEASIREVIPADQTDHHRRQFGAALQRHQSGIQHFRSGRARAMRTYSSTFARSTRPTADFVRRTAHQARGHLSVDDLLLSAGGHDRPDIEFRPALADRRADRRLQRRRRTAIFANNLLQKLRGVAGAVDLHIQQSGDYPQFNVDVDRTKAQLLGLTEQNVASNMLVSLSGSFQTAPSFWVDPKSGTQYQVATQTPQFRLQNLNDLGNTPLSGGHRRFGSDICRMSPTSTAASRPRS